jgi:hypothetical protein
MNYTGPRTDTRRKRHGKILGGHNGGSYGGSGTYMKNQYWRAERRCWKRIANDCEAYGDIEQEIPVRLRSLVGWFSEVDWKGW